MVEVERLIDGGYLSGKHPEWVVVMGSSDERDQVDAALEEVNEKFFALEPWRYLDTRVFSLVALAGKPSEIIELFQDGVVLGQRLRMSATTVDRPNPEDLDRFVAVDSEVLLHHAAETVLRAYFAFASSSDAPWLTIASERRAGRFKQKVADRFVARSGASSDELDLTALVFLGSRRPLQKDGPSYEDWRRATMNIEKFVRDFAKHWLEEAATYNALKHGLVADASMQSLSLLYDEDLPSPYSLEGIAVEVVESDVLPDDSVEWFMRTKWVDVEQNLIRVWIASRLLQAAWQIGSHAHGRPVPGGPRVWFPADFSPGLLQPRRPVHRARLRRSLLIQLPDGSK